MENIFGKRVKKLRLDKGLSQGEMAVILKTYQQNITQWESGKFTPNAKTIMQLALFFEVSSDYLLGLSENFNNNESINNSFNGNNNNIKINKKTKHSV